MLDKPIADITADDIQHLVDEGTPEKRTLEFKIELPGTKDSEKKEFLADVSSFANAVGGDLIFGVATTDGRATAAPGVTAQNVEAEVLRLDQMIRSGISPRIVGFQIHRVPGLRNGLAIVIRIPRSWQGPHIVSYQQHFRFFSRNAAGKFPMDVSDIRAAVLNAGSTEERIRMFRTDRLARIGAAETPVRLNSTRLICVHSAPFMAFSGVGQVDLARAVNRTELLEPLHHAGGWSAPTFNIDGLYTHSPVHHEGSASYLQIFRNGTVEAVDARTIPCQPPYPDAVPSVLFPRKLFAYVTRLVQLYRLLEVEPPYVLFVSLLGVRGIHLGVDLSRGLNLEPLDRDVLMLPELIIDTGTIEPDIELKPLLDTLWQSFGVHGCIDYDESGRWRPRR